MLMRKSTGDLNKLYPRGNFTCPTYLLPDCHFRGNFIGNDMCGLPEMCEYLLVKVGIEAYQIEVTNDVIPNLIHQILLGTLTLKK